MQKVAAILIAASIFTSPVQAETKCQKGMVVEIIAGAFVVYYIADYLYTKVQNADLKKKLEEMKAKTATQTDCKL